MTVDEPLSLVVSNVAWHLSAGAEEVHLYFDRPKDPAIQVVAAIPQVKIVECSDDYWKRLQTKRPNAQTKRQFINANHALKNSSVDWLAHIDADEFLLQLSPIREELRAIQKMDVALHFDVRERVYIGKTSESNIFEGAFRSRSHLPKSLDRAIFGDLARYLQRGLLSHCAGKIAVPTNQNYVLGIHSAYRGRRSSEARVKPIESASTILLHFDGLTPLHWIAKLYRYARNSEKLGTSMFSRPRQQQIAECIESSSSHHSLLAFHNKLRLLDEVQRLRYADYNLLHTEEFNPAIAILSLLRRTTDLSSQAFDAEILAREPEMPKLIASLSSTFVI